MIKVYTLASGSSGNSMLVSCGGTHILIDAGISARRITTALSALSLTAEDLSAILVTHEHTDHIAALPTLLKKRAMQVYGSRGTIDGITQRVTQTQSEFITISTDETFFIGDCDVKSFRTSHDSSQSTCYRIDCADGSIGILTDTGFVTAEAQETLAGVDLLLLEANHDIETLESGPYPYYLKRRILGDLGHLSNIASADFACNCADSGTKEIILAHLSNENNTPSMAFSAVRHKLDMRGFDKTLLSVAPRSELGPVHII